VVSPSSLATEFVKMRCMSTINYYANNLKRENNKIKEIKFPINELREV
jgi:hypothetical protein